jgi:hypothetical protein
MAETKVRRGHGEDAIYFDAAKNRYVGAVSLGFTLTGSGFGGRSRGGPSRRSGQAQGASSRAGSQGQVVHGIYGPPPDCEGLAQ